MFRKISIVIAIFLFPVTVWAASAIGQKANFADSWPVIDYECDNSIAIGVQDARPYVINGEKSLNYAGTVRGGYGNPFDVTTKSDKPLSDDVASAVVSGFKRMGIQAQSIPITISENELVALERLKQLKAKRIIILSLREWRSDHGWGVKSTGFYIDAVLKVYDSEGKELAISSVSHKNEGSGDGTVASSYDAARSYLTKLLNHPKVKSALM